MPIDLNGFSFSTLLECIKTVHLHIFIHGLALRNWKIKKEKNIQKIERSELFGAFPGYDNEFRLNFE